MTQLLFLHQLRFDLLSIRRNRRAQFFIVALPVLLLIGFAGLFGGEAVEVAGENVAANRASVPGIMGLAVLTSSFMALVMTVVSQREAGILKRRRATPVPAAILIVSRALTATVSSVAAYTRRSTPSCSTQSSFLSSRPRSPIRWSSRSRRWCTNRS